MLVRYEIEFWNEIDGTNRIGKGFSTGKNLGEAVNCITNYYGKNNVISIKVYECEEVLCDEEIKEFFT